MELLPKIVMPGTKPSIYDTESATAIEMVAKLYGVMNELISEVNETMANHLKNSIQELLDQVNYYDLVSADTKAHILTGYQKLEAQIKGLSNGTPVPVTHNDQMTDTSRIYVNLVDGNWYYWLDDYWEVGGIYQSTQVADNSITSEKRTVVGDYAYLFSEKGYIVVDVDAKKITFNGTFMVIYRNRIITVTEPSLLIPSSDPYMLYFDTVERIFRFHRPSSDLYKADDNCVYLGYISIADGAYTQIHAPKYHVVLGGKKTTYQNGTITKPTRQADLLSGKVAVDTAGNTITFTNAVYSLGHRYVTVNTSLTYEEVNEARIKYVVYDESDNTVKVYENRNTENRDEILLFGFYQNKIYHSYLNRHLYSVNGVGESDLDNMFRGKTASFLGDSITRGAGSSTPFTTFLAEESGLTVKNFGADGSCIANRSNEPEQSFLDRLTSIEGGDIVGVMGGTNDFWFDVPMGDSVDETNTFTFYGALNNLVQNILTNYPGKFFFLMTPIQGYRSAERISEGFASFPYPTNSLGLTLDDYCEAIRKVGLKYSVPVLDMKAVSGMCPLISSEDKRLFHDGVHPNAEGYKQIAKVVGSFLTSNYR